MNIYQPVPFLESFKRTKLADFIRKVEGGWRGQKRWTIQMPWLSLPWVFLPFISALYLQGPALVIIGAVSIIMMFVTLILVTAAQEITKGDIPRLNLTKAELDKAKELIRKHDK